MQAEKQKKAVDRYNRDVRNTNIETERLNMINRNPNIDILDKAQKIDYVAPSSIKTNVSQNSIDWVATFGEPKGGKISASPNKLPWKTRLDIASKDFDPYTKVGIGFGKVLVDTAELVGRIPDFITPSNRRRSGLSNALVTVRDETIGVFKGEGKAYEAIDFVMKDPVGSAFIVGGVVGNEIINRPEELIGEVAAFGVMGSKSVQEKVLGGVRKISLFEPKVKVTRATGRVAIMQVGEEAGLLLETTSRDVRLSRAPKGNRVSNLDFSAEGFVVDNSGVGYARGKASAKVRVGRGKASVDNFGFVPEEVVIGDTPVVNVIKEPISRVNVREVPVRNYDRLIIRDAEKIIDNKVYPTVITRDVRVKPSVRSIKTNVVDNPFIIDSFSSGDSFFVGGLEKSPKKAKISVDKLNKAYTGYVGIDAEGIVSVRRRGINFKDLYKDAPEADLLVNLVDDSVSGVNVLKSDKVVKKSTKTVNKGPVVRVEGLQNSFSGIKSVLAPQLYSNNGNKRVIIDFEKEKINTSYNTKSSAIFSTDNAVVSELKINNKPKTGGGVTPIIDVFSDVKPSQDIKPVINVDSIIEPKINIIPKTDVVQKQRIKTNNKYKPFKGLLPGISLEVDDKEFDDGFSVFVRRKGFFKLIGSGLKKRDALSLGKGVVGSSAAATFKIPGLTKSDFRDQNYYFGGKGTFIQKRSNRISSGGEIKDITRKGQAAIRNKKKRGLLSGLW